MEQAFIQACLTHWLDPDRPPLAPPQGLDWDRVYALLLQHKLTGIFHLLGKAQRNLWPPELRERLRHEYYSALLWGDRCIEEVGAVLAALRQAGIPVMVLKGWALIPTVYRGDYGQRFCEDIDLVVLPRDAARAEHILRGLGYGEKPETRPEPWPGYYRRHYSHDRTIYSQLSPDPAPFPRVFGIDLHSDFLLIPFHARVISVDHLFERAQPLQIAGIEVCAPSAEDHLVYSCGHLALSHIYDSAWFRYYEMVALIRWAGLAFDWAAVVARARAWRLVIPVQRVIAHLEELWPGTVPLQALAAIAELRPTLAERYAHGIWLEKKKREGDNPAVRFMLDLLTMPGLGRRLRFLLETVFPSPTYMRQCYGPAPGGLWPLLYLRRLATAVKYIAR